VALCAQVERAVNDAALAFYGGASSAELAQASELGRFGDATTFAEGLRSPPARPRSTEGEQRRRRANHVRSGWGDDAGRLQGSLAPSSWRWRTGGRARARTGPRGRGPRGRGAPRGGSGVARGGWRSARRGETAAGTRRSFTPAVARTGAQEVDGHAQLSEVEQGLGGSAQRLDEWSSVPEESPPDARGAGRSSPRTAGEGHGAPVRLTYATRRWSAAPDPGDCLDAAGTVTRGTRRRAALRLERAGRDRELQPDRRRRPARRWARAALPDRVGRLARIEVAGRLNRGVRGSTSSSRACRWSDSGEVLGEVGVGAGRAAARAGRALV